jgi:prefoldin subunit 5
MIIYDSPVKEPNMSQNDSGSIGPWIESYYQLESEIADLLNDIRHLQMQNEHREARERIEGFREGKHDAFRATYYALIGTEVFFDDVREEANEEITTSLQELSEEYSDLTEEFQAVSIAHDGPKKNPVSSGALRRTYDPTAGEPIVDYTLYSGNIPVLETSDTPSQLLNISRLLLNAATASLEQAVGRSLPVSDDEFEETTEETEHLRSEIAELEEVVKSLSESTSEDNSE